MRSISCQSVLNVLFLFCFCAQSVYSSPVAKAATRDTALDVNIGIYAPFSEKRAFIGRSMLGAMEMAQEQVHSSRVHYAFFTLDELPAGSTDTPRVLQQFIDAHHINVLLTEGSRNGLLAAPLAQKNNIVHFGMASDPAIADGVNNFLAWSPVSEQANAFINELKVKQVHQLAIISTDVFNILNQSIVSAMNKNLAFSPAIIAPQLRAVSLRNGVMGPSSIDAHGVLYSKSEVKKVSHGHIVTA